MSDAIAVPGLVRARTSFKRRALLSLDDLQALLSADSPPTRLLAVDESGVLIGEAAVTVDFSLWRERSCHHLD